MELKDVMKQKNFAVVGNTLDEEKFAYKIKTGMNEKGYNVYPVGKELTSINDIDGEIDIVDLCIHPAKGIKLLQECEKPYKAVVIQPGAGSDEITEYLDKEGIDYINNCLLVGLKEYT